MILEVVGQVLFEIAATVGWESLQQSVRREREARPLLAGVGHFLLGAAAGGLSLVLVRTRLTRRIVFPGVSLIVSPIATGVVMHWLGEFWRDRGRDRPVLFTFRAGATFAFGMALVRYLYFERPW